MSRHKHSPVHGHPKQVHPQHPPAHGHKTPPAHNWDGPQPAPRALWTFLHANLPYVRNLGIYNKRNIAGTSTPSLHAEGRALDIGLMANNPNEKVIGDELFHTFIAHAADLGLQEVIWNHEIWSPSKGIHAYHGHNPHTDHVHVGFTREASQKVDFSPSFRTDIGVLRTGLEDLAKANAHLA